MLHESGTIWVNFKDDSGTNTVLEVSKSPENMLKKGYAVFEVQEASIKKLQELGWEYSINAEDLK
jgi:hypothetical protein